MFAGYPNFPAWLKAIATAAAKEARRYGELSGRKAPYCPEAAMIAARLVCFSADARLIASLIENRSDSTPPASMRKAV